MSGIQSTKSAGKSPLYRTRGRSFLLVCVLMINVLLVAVAPSMRPGPAKAQDSKPAVAEKSNGATKPEQVADTAKPANDSTPAVDQVASGTTVANPSADKSPANSTLLKSIASAMTADVATPVAEQADVQSDSAANPPQATDSEPSSATGQDLATAETEPANSDSANVVAPEPESHAVAQTDLNPPAPSHDSSLPVSPTITQPDPLTTPNLMVVNPTETGGTVFYLVDGEVYSLEPGESHDLAEGRDYTIEFHRGDDFGDAKLVLQSGKYQFGVNDTGWHLTATDTSRPEL